jgi:hypothetical protein
MQRDLVALPRDEPVAILFQHRRFRLLRYGMDTGEIRGAVHAFLASGGRTSEPLLRSQASARTLAQHGRMPPLIAMLSVVTTCAPPAGRPHKGRRQPLNAARITCTHSCTAMHPFLHSKMRRR